MSSRRLPRPAADPPATSTATALQLVVAMGRAELADRGTVGAPTWELADALLAQLIAQLPPDPPRQR